MATEKCINQQPNTKAQKSVAFRCEHAKKLDSVKFVKKYNLPRRTAKQAGQDRRLGTGSQITEKTEFCGLARETTNV